MTAQGQQFNESEDARQAVLEEQRFERLPKWAKTEITTLQRHLLEAREELADKLRPPRPSEAFWRSYSLSTRGLPEYMPLPDGQAGFALGTDFHDINHHLTARMSLTTDGAPAVEIIGGRGLRIFPSASNVVTITTRDTNRLDATPRSS